MVPYREKCDNGVRSHDDADAGAGSGAPSLATRAMISVMIRDRHERSHEGADGDNENNNIGGDDYDTILKVMMKFMMAMMVIYISRPCKR